MKTKTKHIAMRGIVTIAGVPGTVDVILLPRDKKSAASLLRMPRIVMASFTSLLFDERNGGVKS